MGCVPVKNEKPHPSPTPIISNQSSKSQSNSIHIENPIISQPIQPPIQNIPTEIKKEETKVIEQKVYIQRDIISHTEPISNHEELKIPEHENSRKRSIISVVSNISEMQPSQPVSQHNNIEVIIQQPEQKSNSQSNSNSFNTAQESALPNSQQHNPPITEAIINSSNRSRVPATVEVPDSRRTRSVLQESVAEPGEAEGIHTMSLSQGYHQNSESSSSHYPEENKNSDYAINESSSGTSQPDHVNEEEKSEGTHHENSHSSHPYEENEDEKSEGSHHESNHSIENAEDSIEMIMRNHRAMFEELNQMIIDRQAENGHRRGGIFILSNSPSNSASEDSKSSVSESKENGENPASPDEFKCKICYTNFVQIILLPCGHTLCKQCAHKIHRQCPYDRSDVLEKKKMFIN